MLLLCNKMVMHFVFMHFSKPNLKSYTSHYPTQSNGDLFTWGGGMYGKLGHGNESGHSNPRRVETLMGLSIVDIACGSRHTAVVTNKGCLYT